MKYHINDDFEVKPCGASDDTRCPFWGHHEGSNHYATESDAVKVVEKFLSDKHPFINRRKQASVRFLKLSEKIKDELQQYGGIKANKLPDVSNVTEMVDEWFGGDRKKYDAFRHNVSNNDLKDATRKNVASLLKTGMQVTNKKSVQDIPLEKSEPYDFAASEITLLDEGPDVVDLEDLRNGNIKAFKF